MRSLSRSKKSYQTNHHSSIINGLLTPKNGFHIFENNAHNSEVSSSNHSLKNFMNSTSSTTETIPSAKFIAAPALKKSIKGSKLYNNSVKKSNGVGRHVKKVSSRPKSPDYNDSFGNQIWEPLQRNISVNELLKSSVIQRRDFVDELEGKLNGLKVDKTTPTFKAITHEDIKTFNFEKELERLKRTLVDIKDQEWRFIKLLSRQSPNKYCNSVSKSEKNNDYSPSKGIEPLHRNSDLDILSKHSSENEYSHKIETNENVSSSLSKFDGRRAYDSIQRTPEKEYRIKAKNTSPQNSWGNKEKVVRKSSLKKKKPVNPYDYNSLAIQKFNLKYTLFTNYLAKTKRRSGLIVKLPSTSIMWRESLIPQIIRLIMKTIMHMSRVSHQNIILNIL